MRPHLRLLLRGAALAGAVLPFLPFTEWPTAMACVTAVSPVISLSAALGARHLAWITLMCLPLVILAFFKHRWFCWHLCPTGFILDLISFRRRPKEHLAAGFPHLGKWLLILGLGMAAAGYPLLMIFDPLSILSGFLSTLQWKNIEWKVFAPALPLLVLIALNIIRPNLWCHRLCPLGAMQQYLGMAGRRSPKGLWRAGRIVIPDLSRAVHGEIGNPGNPDAESGLDSRFPPSRSPLWRAKGLLRGSSFGYEGWKGRGNDMKEGSHFHGNETRELVPPTGVKRRFFLMALLGGIAGWAFVAKKTAAVVRPPGAVNEDIFTGLCSRCGSCINVCPENIIIPDFGKSGLRGLLTPVLKYKHKYCNEWCAKCLLACPTLAIRRLSLEQKRLLAIGTARIDKSLCLAWTNRQDCMVCQEFCPYQAIAAVTSNGVNCPEVKDWVCRGCGACESQCPAIPGKAITVQGRPDQKIIKSD